METTSLSALLSTLQSGQNLFLTGGAGTGKTTLTRQIIAAYGAEGKKVAKLASTGMAAALIGGQTLHSFFDLGIADSETDLERRGKLIPKKKIVKLVRAMDLIVIDEISMVSAEVFDMVRLRLLQCGFDGVLLVVGDFLQLPPVTRGTIRFAFEAPSWGAFAFETVTLTHNWRSEDAKFNSILNAVRHACVGEEEHRYLHELIKPTGDDLSCYTFLYGTNRSAFEHNREQLDAVDGDLYAFETQSVCHDAKTQPREVQRFMEDARIPEILELKIGAPVLFTRNSWNYINGERGSVVKLEQDAVSVRKSDGTVVKLERVGTQKSRWEERTVEQDKQMVEVPLITLYQFPIVLAFAITIHKSQGMSISDLVIDTTEIFAPSQFYVALSRAVSPYTLILKQPRVNWANLAFVHPKALAFVTA
ncbi:MAG: AAA family ATPase [Campylobacterales bacterium]|nr:AAA family ATPase [Campylobacterales bacterium]